MPHCEEITGRFFVAPGQSAKLLEATEKAFDFIPVAVDKSSGFAVLFTENDDLRTQCLASRRHGVCILDSVDQYVASTLGGHQQVRRPLAIRLLAGSEYHAQRVAQRIDQPV